MSVKLASFAASGRSRAPLRPTTLLQRPSLPPHLQLRLMQVLALPASTVHWPLRGLFLALLVPFQAQPRQSPLPPVRPAQQDPTARMRKAMPFLGRLPEQRRARPRQQVRVTLASSALQAQSRLDRPPASVLQDKSARQEVPHQWHARLAPTRPRQLKEIALPAPSATSVSKVPHSICRVP